MESSILYQNKKQDSPLKKMQDLGSVNKKKKDRENRSVMSSGIEWEQNDQYITVSIANSQDNCISNVKSEEQELIFILNDGRRFQIKLFERINPESTIVSIQDSICLIKLKKQDSTTQWTSLEFCRNSHFENSKNFNFSPTNISEMGLFKDNDKTPIKIMKAKTNFVERNGEPYMTVHLYIANIKKDNIIVNFSTNLITVLFSCTDPNFLKTHADGDSSSRFEWSLIPKYEIVPDQCSFKLTSTTLEIKLKKAVCQNWSTLTENSDESPSVTKNAWVPVPHSESPKPLSNIPPAPPVPPSFLEAKKPFSLVPPANKTASTLSNFPVSTLGAEAIASTNTYPQGMVGLDNIGNTCFMNSVLQCLANCRELREYFLESNFQQDLNKENPLGMGGKLAISFAILMKSLWSRSIRSYAPSKLKSVMSLKANQFSGFAQHDAQEFMVELLDGLHEDLNLIKKKPYMAEPPDLDGWSDEDAAEESWRLHKLRNDSIIDDLFKGQFKSTLKCHECNKISVKFDEFCCLSVPIPKDQKTIQVIFFWRNTGRRPTKYSIRVSADALVEELKQQLSSRTGIHSNFIQVMEVVKYKIFGKCSTLSNVLPSDVLMAFEILSPVEAGENVIELAVMQRMMLPSPPSKCSSCSRQPPPNSNLKRCTKCYRVGYCDTNCQKSHWNSHKMQCSLVPEPVGAPFIVSIRESQATYINLSRLIESYARFSVNIFQPPVSQTQTSRRRQGSTSSGELSSDAEEMEVDSEGSCGASKENELESGSYRGEDRAEADWPLSGSSGTNHAVRGRQCRSSSVSSNSSASNSSGGEEIPQLSNSPKGRGLPQQRVPTSPTTKLFILRPVNNRAQTMPPPIGDPLTDKGSEPLDLSEVHYIAMDWCTNERLPVHCFVQNKDIECEVKEEESVERNKHTTLEACIDLFTQPENLSEGDSWRCPRCKKPVEATKQMSVWRLPSVLIIQLKRFSFKYVLYSDKIDKFVQYPIRNLDMRSFMSEGSKNQPTVYDLFGVINHMGRLLGGHYTAYCRTVSESDTKESEIDWRLCDDSRVSMVSESRVVHEQAYLLMYRRRNDPFVINRPLPPKMEDDGSEDENEVFESSSSQHDPESQMEASSTPLSLSSSVSQISSSDPPSTVQEELD